MNFKLVQYRGWRVLTRQLLDNRRCDFIVMVNAVLIWIPCSWSALRGSATSHHQIYRIVILPLRRNIHSHLQVLLCLLWVDVERGIVVSAVATCQLVWFIDSWFLFICCFTFFCTIASFLFITGPKLWQTRLLKCQVTPDAPIVYLWDGWRRQDQVCDAYRSQIRLWRDVTSGCWRYFRKLKLNWSVVRVQALIRVELGASGLWLGHNLIKRVLLRLVSVMVRVHQARLLPIRHWGRVNGLITDLNRVQIHLIDQIFIENFGLIRWPLRLRQNILPHFDLMRQFGAGQASCCSFG